MLIRRGRCGVNEAADACDSFGCDALRDRLVQAAVDTRVASNSTNRIGRELRERKEDFSIRVVAMVIGRSSVGAESL